MKCRFEKDVLDGKTGYAILVILLLSIGVYAYRDYLAFKKVFVFTGFASDTLHQFFADYYFRCERLFSGNFSFWSFQHELGTNVYPLIANFNPFDILLISFGKRHFAGALAYVVLLKIVISGVLFYGYLKKLELLPTASVMGALSFAYCGYMVLNSHWYHYQNYAVFAALILFLFERWYQEGKWLLLVLAIGLACIKGILQLYQFAFFLPIYGIFRILYSERHPIKKIPVFLFKLAVLYACGVGLGAFYILPEAYQAFSSARGGESMHQFTLARWISDVLRPSDAVSIRTFLYRYFSNDIFGSFERFKGISNYLEAPASYVGIPAILSAPLVFMGRMRKQKSAFLFLSAICMIYFIFPYMRVIGNAFASGTFKHTIMYNSICIILLASFSLSQLFHEPRNMSARLVPLGFFCGLLIVLFLYKEIPKDPKVLSYATAFVLIYAILILFHLKTRFQKFLKYIFLAVLTVELAVFARVTVSRSSGALLPGFIERGERYFDKDTLRALNAVKSNDHSFYRIEKGYYSDYLNDAVVQNYFGTSAYYGFPSMGVVDFHRSLKISQKSPRIASYRYGLQKRNKLQSLLGVKYFLTKSKEDRPDGFEYLHSYGSVHVYQNKKYFPLGHVYHRYSRRNDFETLSTNEKEEVLLNCFISNKDYEHIDRISSTTMKNMDSLNRGGRIDGEKLQIINFKEDRIKGYIQLKRDGMLFLNIPFNKGWKAVVDGKEATLEMVNIAFLGLPLKKGRHQIELHFVPPYLIIGLIISFLSASCIFILYSKFPQTLLINPGGRV